MGEYLDQIPENIQGHVKQLAKISGLPDTEESTEAIARGWLEKKAGFEEQLESRSMEEVDYLEKDDDRGCLIMTYSGSLLNIGPLVEGVRKAEYASIGLRQDVPETAAKDDSRLAEDIRIDGEVAFAAGPIKQSSPVFKIAVPMEDMEAEEQEELLSQVTQLLAEEFVEVNKTIMLDEPEE
jgi:hypothetical protein